VGADDRHPVLGIEIEYLIAVSGVITPETAIKSN
jgi:hypothetical protein